LWDWGAGFCLHIDDKLENTWEYEGQQSDSWFLHPSIDDFISIIDTVSVKYQELHPDLPPLLAIANGVAGFWMYDWADGNDYRRALLGSNAVDLIWQEMGVVFGERNQPNSHYLHTILHLKYMKDIPVVMERKRVGLQVRVRDSEPTDRDKLFVLGYAYLFNDRDRMAITYVAEGQDGNPNYDLETSHWAGPAMEFDIGQPVVNPPGVRDINGHENTNVFYEWARGEDPGNDWQTYTIFARQYENVMVLVKVRESADAVWDETTETTHSLGRLWSPLRADGTLGDPVTSITLKNNEAAILVAVNSPPFLEAPLSKTIPEGEELAFTVHAYDCDQYDDLALSATNMPPGADFIDNHDRTGTFRWTPNYFQEGVHPGIRFDVTDGEAIFSRELTITVTDVEQPPAGAPDMPAAPATPGFYLKNPYRAGSSIVLWSANVDHSDVEIFDVFGRKVRSLHVGLGATSGADAGRGVMRPLAVSWDGRNDAGGKVRAGVYILRAQGAAGRLQRKLILIER
jgi:hypothetical protein